MSLFKAREWWSAVLGEGEEFDQGCLCVADVDNSGGGYGERPCRVTCQNILLFSMCHESLHQVCRWTSNTLHFHVVRSEHYAHTCVVCEFPQGSVIMIVYSY